MFAGLWPISSLGDAKIVAELNPAYHLIEITRAPLLGEFAGLHSWLAAIALAIPVAVFTQVPADSVSPRAKQLHDHAIVVDSHADTTQRLIFDEAFSPVRYAGMAFILCGLAIIVLPLQRIKALISVSE